MNFDANSFEIQRWNSAAYVESWITNHEQEGGRKTLRRKLVDTLPFESVDSIRVLDVGVGGGALSQEILTHFPNAQIVCQDFSEIMLGHARQHLAKFANQVIFVQSDLSTPGWIKSISGTFDAVATSLVMHTVPGRVKDIYQEIFNIVKTNGCFTIGDNIFTPGPTMRKVYMKMRLDNLRKALNGEKGIEANPEEIERRMQIRQHRRSGEDQERVRNPLRTNLTLESQLEWLKAVGFNEVDCPWKEMQRAVIVGIKH